MGGVSVHPSLYLSSSLSIYRVSLNPGLISYFYLFEPSGKSVSVVSLSHSLFQVYLCLSFYLSRSSCLSLLSSFLQRFAPFRDFVLSRDLYNMLRRLRLSKRRQEKLEASPKLKTATEAGILMGQFTNLIKN